MQAERREAAADDRQHLRLRDLHARSAGARGQLESRRRADQRLSRGRDPGRELLALLHRRGRRQRAAGATSWRSAAREGRFEEEGWRIRKDGSRFWASVVIAPMRDTARTARRLRQDHARPDPASKVGRRTRQAGAGAGGGSTARRIPVDRLTRAQDAAHRTSAATPDRPGQSLADGSESRRQASTAPCGSPNASPS